MDGEEIAKLVDEYGRDPLQLVAAVDSLGDGPPESEGPELWRYKDNLKDTVAVLQLIERQCGTSPPWNSLPMLTASLQDVVHADLDDEISAAEGDRVFCRFLDALETFRAAVLVNHRLQHPDAAAATPDASGDEVPPRFCDHTLVSMQQLATHAGCDRKTISGWLRNIRHAKIRSNAKWFRYSDVRDRLVEVCRNHKNAHQRSIVWPKKAADLRTS